MAMNPAVSKALGLRPEVGLLAAAFVTLAVFAFEGVRAGRVAATRRQEAVRAEATLATFADLRKRFKPAVAAESIAWRRAWIQARELGAGDRLQLTQHLTRAAEDAGLRDVRVLIQAPDTVGVRQRLSTEDVQSKLAPYSLRIECSGDMQSVIAFLGQLPPSVSPTRLSLVRQDGRGPHRISLAVYEFTFTNGAPADWSSNERGTAGSSPRGRPGG